ncbi:hypothetical protein ASF48_07020 [Rathayibacter sp. Leaf299]|uniref:hypothetical protein n=1 Tax=Rathayibacter sp. Leaf299 TaxID=1736328 RepID=UPI0006F99B33|nr:hypothetical protein [Rathayibacter sp. Leaf299]KQQ22882.1 hypothetical protein ASF48_07020 [Rathayibacter sp. Leaf299]
MGTIRGMDVLYPQQLRLADVCNNVDSNFIGILQPRRSAKTSSLLALAMGRCSMIDDYRVAYVMLTTGKKARDRFNDGLVKPLERVYPDPKSSPVKIYRGSGMEKLDFTNGSILQILSPNGAAFRSESYDLIILDEGGEADEEMGDDVLAGALSTMDTRPDAQIIVAGTAGTFRKGQILYEALLSGRAGKARAGILEYAAPETTTDADLQDEDGEKCWQKARPLVERSHPGVGFLTRIEVVEERFEKLKLSQFKEEYLSIFGDIGTASGALDFDTWTTLGTDEEADIPKRFTMAAAVHPDQTFTAIAIAWRVNGVAHIAVREHRPGVAWLGQSVKANYLATKMATAVDSQGPITVETEAMLRMRPKPKLIVQTMHNITTAAALLAKEVETKNLVHYKDDVLDSAVRVAGKRNIGDRGKWAFSRGDSPENDITALEAAAMALRQYDTMPTGPARKMIVVGG